MCEEAILPAGNATVAGFLPDFVEKALLVMPHRHGCSEHRRQGGEDNTGGIISASYILVK
ncbi:MAG: hypothetical protein D6704_07035 [Nitrospirae bacterium]|nr:MAG: hypothetical protein D6704_07035 [Nitrospirota bacterium]